MTNFNYETCDEKELWAHIASHLQMAGVDTVLVGGAVVSIYSAGAYRSGDLDLVNISGSMTIAEEVLNRLGFNRRHGSRFFINPQCTRFYVELKKDILEIGDDTNIVPEEMELAGTSLKILSPTDCVKNRLAQAIHWDSKAGIDQAYLVASKHPVNLAKIEKWCKKEDKTKGPKTFKEFIDLLNQRPGPG